MGLQSARHLLSALNLPGVPRVAAWPASLQLAETGSLCSALCCGFQAPGGLSSEGKHLVVIATLAVELCWTLVI